MLQVLDRFRKEFEKESKIPYNVVMENNKDQPNPYLSMPSWNYVCWLEHKLAEYEGWFETESYTITTASTFKGEADASVSENKR